MWATENCHIFSLLFPVVWPLSLISSSHPAYLEAIVIGWGSVMENVTEAGRESLRLQSTDKTILKDLLLK